MNYSDSSALDSDFMNTTIIQTHNTRFSMAVVTNGESCVALETGFLVSFPFCITSLNEMLHFRG